MEEGMGYLGKIILASPQILGTPSLPTYDKIAGLGSSSLLAREWTYGATKFLIESRGLRTLAQWCLSNKIGRGLRSKF